jgi:hypothetical protein
MFSPRDIIAETFLLQAETFLLQAETFLLQAEICDRDV